MASALAAVPANIRRGPCMIAAAVCNVEVDGHAEQDVPSSWVKAVAAVTRATGRREVGRRRCSSGRGRKPSRDTGSPGSRGYEAVDARRHDQPAPANSPIDEFASK